MRGLPASGKTTMAREIVGKGSTVRITRDYLRSMLFFDKDTKHNSELLAIAAVELTTAFLKVNVNVVIDECNLGEYHYNGWRDTALAVGAKFEVQPVTASVSTCRFRDAARKDGEKAGADVITNMALKHGMHPAPEKGFILCDIDGTIANINHRLHFVKKEKKDWGSFFGAIPRDTVRPEVAQQLMEFQAKGYDIVFISARPDTYKKETLLWLIQHTEKYLPQGFLTLIMRKATDQRPDVEVKKEMLDTFFPDRSHVHAILDDRPSVIRMWQEEKMNVIDVGAGVEF